MKQNIYLSFAVVGIHPYTVAAVAVVVVVVAVVVVVEWQGRRIALQWRAGYQPA
jgi:hypothetical protein